MSHVRLINCEVTLRTFHHSPTVRSSADQSTIFLLFFCQFPLVDAIHSSAFQNIQFPNAIIAPLEHGTEKVKLTRILPHSISKHNHPFIVVGAHLPILPIGMLVDNQRGSSEIPHPMTWTQQKNALMSQNKGGKLSSMSACGF